MTALIRHAVRHPALALGSTLAWGLIEFVALQRARLRQRRQS